MELLNYILAFFISFIITFIATPIVRAFSIRNRIVSYPKKDRWRKRVVATLGGVSIFTSTTIVFLLFSKFDISFLGFLIGGMLIFCLGLTDDIIHIKPDTKLIGQIIVACFVIMFGVAFNITSNPLINLLFTILWIVGIINSFNLLDNMDGLCVGITAISSAMLAIHSLMNANTQLLLFSIAILGACLGFLRFNFTPAKIFMGDCGSMFLGYNLAMIALFGAAKEKSGLLMTLALPSMFLAVPIFDTLLVTLSRTMNNRPISKGGRDHISHRLVALGMSEKTAVIFLYIVSGICGLLAVTYEKMNIIINAIIITILAVSLLVFGIFLGSEVQVYSESELERLRRYKRLNGKVILNGFVYNKKRILEVILDFILITISYVASYLLRYEGMLSDTTISLILQSLPILLILKFFMFYFFGLYRGVWCYIGLYDLVAIFKATTASTVLSIVVILFLFRFKDYSRTVFIIDWFITFVFISGVRILFRIYKEFFANIRLTGKRILIFGAGDAGELALREIRQNRALGYKPVGFVDDDESKQNRVIHGIKVLGRGDELEKLIYKYKVDEVLIAIPSSKTSRLKDIQHICSKVNIPFGEISKIIPEKPLNKEG